MPALSVIVPVYNVEPYIARCARSLFGQSLKDIEYLFIDDCTPDRSVDILKEVLEEFPERKPQVRILRMPQNSGQARVRMYGISQAAGDYVIHCDSDDYVDTDMYSALYAAAAEGDLDIVACNCMRRAGGNWETVRQSFAPGRELEDILYIRSYSGLCCRLVRRSLLEDIVPPVGNMGEDLVISVQAVARAKRFGSVPRALYYYETRPDSISRQSGAEAAVARSKSYADNVSVLVKALTESYGLAPGSDDLVFLKYNSRHWLEPLVHIPEYYRIWRNTFPEIDRRFLWIRGISAEDKFWFAAIHLRLFRPIKSITGRLRGRKAQ